MALQASVSIVLAYVGNGAGPMSVPAQQSIKLSLAPVTMPGGDSVTAGNLNTLGTNIGSAAQTAMNAILSQLSGWTTGGQ